MKKNIDEFYVADRKNGVFTVSLSLVSSIIGASSGIGIAGHFYNLGFSGIWWILSGSIGLSILALFFVSRIQIDTNYTLPELLGKHYGKEVRIFSGLCISISWIGIISAQILAAGYLLHYFFPNINLTFSFIVVGSIFIFYTSYGGQKAILKTDVIQAILLIISFLILFFIAFNKDIFVSVLLAIPSNFITQKFGIYKILEMLIIVGFPYLIGPDIYSRIFSSNSIPTAKKSILIAAIIIFLIGLIIFFIVNFYVAVQAQLINNPDMILYEVINYYIPSLLLKSIVLIGLLSLIMSSADTCLLSAGSIIVYDVTNQIFTKTEFVKNNIVKLTRISIFVFGILSVIIAMFSRAIISNLFMSYKIYTVALGMPGLFMLMFKSVKLSKSIVIISILCSVLALILAEFVFHLAAAGLISLFVSFLILTLALIIN